MRLDLLSALNAERAARRACVLVTSLEGGEQRLVRAAEVAEDPLAAHLTDALRTGRSGTIAVPDGSLAFLRVQVPPLRLVVVGAVHVSQALVPMAQGLDLDMTIVDPRTAFASEERFPGVRVLAQWPDEALPALGGVDRYTALACLTHDPKIDDPALEAALRGEALYIGALGSRRTHAKRVERLQARGFSDADLARIHGPIGLDIGAITPAEIALSILAQLVAAVRQRGG